MKVKSYQTMVREYRQRMNLLVRSMATLDSSRELTELELIEALRLINTVVSGRLTGPFTEWKGDAKRGYSVLFDSIKIHTIDTIKDYFASGSTRSAKGFVLNKFCMLIIDSIFDVLQAAGPKRSTKLIAHLTTTGIRDILKMKSGHTDDAIIAHALLAKYSRDRADQRQKIPKQQRFSMIHTMTSRIQAA